MKVSGFSFIKDAIKYDYPIIEAITSILPICDEFIIAVGKSSDETLKLIQNINSPKIKIIQTEWDENLREGGKVLAIETDKALTAISRDSDWAFYIQGDEVIHEQYLDNIQKGMLDHKNNPKVDGLLFNYLHFYGSYDYIGVSSNWYPKEIRIIKTGRNIYSYGDAQGFRKGNDEKLNVVPIDAFVYHYGWVKDPRAMQQKQENFNKYWHDDKWVEENVIPATEFDYSKKINELKLFQGTHPKVMQNRIAEKNWKFDYDISFNNSSTKDKMKKLLLKIGIDSYYKNYRIIKT